MKFFLFFVSIALIWGGGQALYTNATNLEPSEYSFSNYITEKPQQKWLTLTNCELNLLDASYFSYFGATEATEIYIPVKSPDAGKMEFTHVLLASKDPEMLRVYNELMSMEDESQIIVYTLQNRDSIFIQKDLTGLVRFGIELDDEDRQELQDLNENLASDFVIIDEGLKPDWSHAALLPAGLLLLAWIFGLIGKKKAHKKSGAEDIAI